MCDGNATQGDWTNVEKKISIAIKKQNVRNEQQTQTENIVLNILCMWCVAGFEDKMSLLLAQFTYWNEIPVVCWAFMDVVFTFTLAMESFSFSS